MDEKTAELRDIFMNVTDGDTVTEQQEEARGSLTEDEEAIEGKLQAVIERMREQLSFETDLSNDALQTVVREFYAGESDADISDALDIERDAVVRARLDLHLVRRRETDAPFDLDDLRALLAEDRTVVEMADELGVAESTVRRYRRIVETQDEIRRVNGRYTDEFEELLTDADLQDHTEDVKQDGLEDATEGMETNVSF